MSKAQREAATRARRDRVRAEAAHTITEGDVPDVTKYALIIAFLSGGKDGQTALRVVADRARASGRLDRLHVVHADLGEAEWEGSVDLARAQAAAAAVPGERFHVVARTITTADGSRVREGLLTLVRRRGAWPDATNRYCTSAMKRDASAPLVTKLVNWYDPGRTYPGPVPVLIIMGMRAEEGPERAAKPSYRRDPRLTNKRRRHVDLWLPVHTWRLADIWSDIHTSNVPYSPVYDSTPGARDGLGLRRHSSRLCPLMTKSDLVASARRDPETAAQYAAVEAEIGHDFKHGLPMAHIVELAQNPDANEEETERGALFEAPSLTTHALAARR
ncbi:phosphoadenosine phosphosulfate reductase family protein [Embleya sp. NPDC059237]|uniref:phosphoadenosine phosphosulfate reductase domain-containing protein n=1 Tax=Embleya sp. NPDC059237 TaxID=3346784 RepID=UPI00369AD44E